MFYEFNQNNSGGSFDFDEDSGITHWVIIEADSEDEAIKKAEDIGLYFDVCNSGIDCECCGYRWSSYDIECSNVPSIYGEPITKKIKEINKWMQEGKEACVHYKDGNKEWH